MYVSPKKDRHASTPSISSHTSRSCGDNFTRQSFQDFVRNAKVIVVSTEQSDERLLFNSLLAKNSWFSRKPSKLGVYILHGLVSSGIMYEVAMMSGAHPIHCMKQSVMMARH